MFPFIEFCTIAFPSTWIFDKLVSVLMVYRAPVYKMCFGFYRVLEGSEATVAPERNTCHLSARRFFFLDIRSTVIFYMYIFPTTTTVFEEFCIGNIICARVRIAWCTRVERAQGKCLSTLDV